MPGKNRHWHRRWTIDAHAQEARHDSGLVVAFSCAPHGGNAPPGLPRNAPAVLLELERTHGPHNAPAMLRRFIAEAPQAYAYARPHERHH